MKSDASFEGKLTNVEGTLFDQGTPSSTFFADGATVIKGDDQLALDGNVKIVNLAKQATLRCDSLRWTSKSNRIVAKGNVFVEAPGYKMGPSAEVWASPDLSKVATPDLYQP